MGLDPLSKSVVRKFDFGSFSHSLKAPPLGVPGRQCPRADRTWTDFHLRLENGLFLDAQKRSLGRPSGRFWSPWVRSQSPSWPPKRTPNPWVQGLSSHVMFEEPKMCKLVPLPCKMAVFACPGLSKNHQNSIPNRPEAPSLLKSLLNPQKNRSKRAPEALWEDFFAKK